MITMQGNDIIPRKDGIYSASGVATRMVETLQSRKRSVPQCINFIKRLAYNADLFEVASS